MNTSQPRVYRGCTPVTDARYSDDSHLSPTEVIVDAVATAAGVDPVALPPLYNYVDPDALDALFESHEGDRDTVLGFAVDTWNVYIRSDGRIRVCDTTEPTDPEPVFDSTPP